MFNVFLIIHCTKIELYFKVMYVILFFLLLRCLKKRRDMIYSKSVNEHVKYRYLMRPMVSFHKDFK